jgi:hypothetical protein
MTAKRKPARRATPPHVREMVARQQRPGFRELCDIYRAVADLERRVERFREQHPPGHRCEVCDHLRALEAIFRPAGPADTLASLHVSLWQHRCLMDEYECCPLDPTGRALDPGEEGWGSPGLASAGKEKPA